jgi:hypothetical protein
MTSARKGMTMMKTITWRRTAASLAVSTLLLAACGGGGGGGDTVAPVDTSGGSDVPQSATASSAGAIAFMKSVAATSDSTAEPLRVGDAVLATSDTDEPDPGV